MSEPNGVSAPSAPPPSTAATPSASTSNSQSTTKSAASQPQDAQPKHKPFPTVTGGCVCNTIRYRLLKSPLFCYACHCPDCQKSTGSAFGLLLNIELFNIRVLSPTLPVAVTVTRRLGLVSRHVECPKCKCELWSTNVLGPAIADVRVGTLDYPSLMEPDVHSFVESKLEWLRLPDDARTVPGQFEHKKMWPESSLRRLDSAVERWAKNAAAAAKQSADAKEEAGAGDGEKTPTAGEFGVEEDDDEAFEKRFRETERALQERLEKLSKKLEEEDGKSQADLEKLTANLEIADSNGGEAVKAKDGIVSEPVD